VGAAEDHVLDERRIEAPPGEQRADAHDGQIVGAHVLEEALLRMPFAEGRPDGIDDDGFTHGPPPPARHYATAVRVSLSTKPCSKPRSATQDFLGRGHGREHVALAARATAVPRLAKPARQNGHAPFQRSRGADAYRLAIGPVCGGRGNARVRLPRWLRQPRQDSRAGSRRNTLASGSRPKMSWVALLAAHL